MWYKRRRLILLRYPTSRSPLFLADRASNIAKFIGPAGLAVIAGASNYVAPKATLDAIVPGFEYFAAWYLLAVIGFLFVGIETRGRTIEELDAALVKPAAVSALAG